MEFVIISERIGFFTFCILVWNIRRFVGDLISNCVIMEFNYGINYQRKSTFFIFCIMVWNIRRFVGDLISN